MSKRDFFYYLIEGGTVKAAYETFITQHKAQIAARIDCAKKYGATGTWGNRSGLIGLVFEEGTTPPAGWKRVPKSEARRPIGQTPEAKTIRKEFSSLPAVTWVDFQESLGVNALHFMCLPNLYYMTVQKIGPAHVLCVPKVSDTKWEAPEGCRSLKTSEYHALLEALEESQKMGATEE